MKLKTLISTLPFLAILCTPQEGYAGILIDKIYHPYVNPMEQELEWRGIFQDHQPSTPDNAQLHRFAYGRSLSDRVFAEAYLVASKSSDTSFDIEAYELEFVWQLTEAGEFWADWGMLFEVEKEANLDKWEFTTGVLMEKERGRWSGTVNLFMLNKWGSDSTDNFEERLSLQARYRYSRGFEPAVEFYSGEDTVGLGPACQGQIKLDGNKKLNWEAGLIFGLGSSSPNQILRFLLDLEF